MSVNKIAKTAFVAASAALLTACGHGISAGSGEQVGNVSRLTLEGNLDACQTWEGEIAAISFRGRAAGSGSTLDFHVDNPEVVKQLQDAQQHQKTVMVEFAIRNWTGACTMSNNDVITKVTVMDNHVTGPIVNLKQGDLDDDAAPANGNIPQQGSVLFRCEVADQNKANATSAVTPTTSAVQAPVAPQPSTATQSLPWVLQPH